MPSAKGMKVKVSKKGKSDVKRLKKALANTAKVLVGIPEDAAPYPDGTSVAMVATVHEFGIHQPERSFMRSTLKENRKEYIKKSKSAILDAVRGDKPLKKSLAILGTTVASDIKSKITSLRTPANTAETIAGKGSSNPLIDTGHLKESVTYEVVDK